MFAGKLQAMPAYAITYTHSHMPDDYIGKAIKYAQTEDIAVGMMTKSPKTATKSRTIIDKNRNTLTILSINEDK